ncbi:MAG: peptide ABC transporter substrate-binding protein [Bdellovibrionales bacterium]|nr:peptide ABC transporter substrate-binding protein [Bdellovibrionales bacterium]
MALAATLGNPNAPKGGIFYVNLSTEPSTLNAITATEVVESEVNGYVVETLLTRNVDTYEWEPALAESYSVSKDGMEYTFVLRDGVKFHDGKPVTAEDVKFSFDVYFMPEYAAVALRGYYENFESVTVVDPKTIKFKVKTKYHLNFDVAAALSIFPKHVYGDPKKGKRITRTSMGTGPYKFEKWEKGKRIILARNSDWYGWGLEENKGKYNFDKIIFRFAKDQNIAIEMLKKGNLDYLKLDEESYVKKTSGPEWGKTVFKDEVITKYTKPYNFVAFNLKRPIFQDVRVRKGLAHLMNRKLMNEKFYYNKRMLTAGPNYAQSEYSDPSVKPIEYDVKKAVALFKEAGWADTDKDGTLDKVIDGKKTPLRFTIFNANPDRNKFYTMYKEDAKKAGVQIDIQLIEWNSLVKLLEERSFDCITLGWGNGSINWDPKQIWHSASMAKGGSNFISYSNPEVDKLIDKARETLDKEDRKVILNKVYKLIADDVPYIFMFNEKYDFYGRTAKMKMKKKSYQYTVGTEYWWTTP